MQWNWITVLDILSYLIGIWALFTIPANRKPGEATAWLLLIFLAPILGAALFLLLGSPKLSRWRREYLSPQSVQELFAQGLFQAADLFADRGLSQ